MSKTNGALGGNAQATPIYYNTTMALPFLVVASVTLMVQASQHCIDMNRGLDREHCVKQYAFAVAAGAVSTGLLLIFVLLQKFGCDSTATTVKPYLAGFLMLWWFVTTCVLTFDRPYLVTGNGYFACWLGVIAAYVWTMDCCTTFKQQSDRVKSSIVNQNVTIILVASAVELTAAAISCDNSHDCSKERGYAVAVGAVSLCACIVALLVPQCNKVLSLCVFIWWIPGVYVLTFSAYGGSFAAFTGNGYFASWSAMIFSACFFMSHWAPETELALPVTGPKSQGP